MATRTFARGLSFLDRKSSRPLFRSRGDQSRLGTGLHQCLTWLGHFGLLEIVCGQDGNAHVRKGFVFHRLISFGSLLIFQFLQSRFHRLPITLPLVRQSSEAASDGVTRSPPQGSSRARGSLRPRGKRRSTCSSVVSVCRTESDSTRDTRQWSDSRMRLVP